jgi:hypothetical protein
MIITAAFWIMGIMAPVDLSSPTRTARLAHAMIPLKEPKIQSLQRPGICFTMKRMPPTIMTSGTMYAIRPITEPRAGTDG